MNNPQISVIIPTFNNGPEIERAILSVKNQEGGGYAEGKLEIIIVSDGSDNNKLNYLRELLSRYEGISHFHLEQQVGPAAARNFAIRKASAQFISFLDADDEWTPTKISTLLPYFVNENIEVAGGKVKYLVEPGLPQLDLEYEDEEKRLTHVHLGALLIRRSLFEKGFYFDEELTFSEDMDWWLRLREKNVNIIVTEETTLLYHVHGNNMSVFKSVKQLQLLSVLNKSIRRRKENGSAQNIPQLKDFRVERPDPLISVVLPLYNGAKHIARTIKSIQAQSYTNWELLVIDDGSTDNGPDLIKENFPEAKLVSQKNSGVASARNLGIKIAKGDIIAFIDQDDEWLPNKLFKQWLLLRDNPYLTFVTCNQQYLFEPGFASPSFFKTELLNQHRSLVPSAVVIRKHALITVGGFDKTLKLGSDMDLIRILRNAGYKEGNVDEVLLHKWYHGSNESMDKQSSIKDMLRILYNQVHRKND